MQCKKINKILKKKGKKKGKDNQIFSPQKLAKLFKNSGVKYQYKNKYM